MARTTARPALARAAATAACAVVLGHAGGSRAAPRTETSYRDVAATSDGGAWLVVEHSTNTQPTTLMGSYETRSELQRIDAAGRAAMEPLPTPSRIQAIAAEQRDGSLWVVTTDAALRRDAAGRWRSVALPESLDWAMMYGTTVAVVTPLAHDRALVFRRCALATSSDCTDVIEVDLAAERADEPDDRAVTTRFAARVGPAVADGQGGAWTVVSRGFATEEKVGYAHVTAAGWEAWSYSGLVVDGMRDRGTSPAFPHTLAIAADGVVGADDGTVFVIGGDGRPRSTARIPHEDPWASETLGVVPRGDALAIVTGVRFFADNPSLDASPVVHRVSPSTGRALGSERVPTPRWWRARHDQGTPRLRVSAAGVGLWILSGDAVFWNTGAWHTLGDPDAEHRTFGDRHPVVSVPMSVGVGCRGSACSAAGVDTSGLAVGLRPELMWARNRYFPSVGLGGFVEAVRLGGAARETAIGGGATVALYGDVFSAAASLGVDARWLEGRSTLGPVFSMFVGLRSPWEVEPLDAPFGLRIDVRPGTGGLPGSFAISASLDTASAVYGAVVLGEAVSALLDKAQHH